MPGYYRRYRRRSYYRTSWSQHNTSERNVLSVIAGGIDKDIERIFLSLPPDKLGAVFARYGNSFGLPALTYARDTYQKWKSGEVKMSGKIAGRLLNLVPAVLDTDARFALVKKLREAHRPKITRRVWCEPLEWRSKVAPEIAHLLASSSQFELPKAAAARIRWLADGDAQAAQQLLAAAEQEEAIARLRHLEGEFRRIDSLIQGISGQTSISHIIQIPQGTVHVTIGSPAKSGCIFVIFAVSVPIVLGLL